MWKAKARANVVSGIAQRLDVETMQARRAAYQKAEAEEAAVLDNTKSLGNNAVQHGLVDWDEKPDEFFGATLDERRKLAWMCRNTCIFNHHSLMK